jgi:acyl transferase domain-containing protein
MNNNITSNHQTGLEIAIIGMAGRFPGAKTVGEFWRNLRDGIESISEFSDAELIAAGVDPALLGHPNYVKAGTVLDDIELFDAAFFGYTPREAEILSPQHRCFLECAHEALENASYNPQTYKSPIGVYAAASTNDYALNNLFSNPDLVEAVGGFPIAIANGEYLSTLVSYKLDLRGASITVQTACSSSLVAIHLACQGLLSGDCGMALAGGVSIRLPQKSGYLYQEGGILSNDGHCRTFDAKAKGSVVGNGVGIIVLKRLEDALADGDRIDAVIKGSAINNDGAWKIGYTAPSIEGQANAIRAAQVSAEIEPETISYIEAHGTATPLGDPIEIAALSQAFRTSTEKKGFCAIGSIKSNMGHMDAAAGVAGVMKTALALRHQTLPPSLHFEQSNPKIDFDNSPFYVNIELAEWKATDAPRRAGVSSFGIGGTNAHAILEEAPQVDFIKTDDGKNSVRPWQLLILSAKTETALETMTVNLAEYLQQHPEINFADVVHTLQVGRRTFNHRRMLVCRDGAEAFAALKSPESGAYSSAFQEQTDRSVTFLFPGQGSQYANMGRELYQVEPTFRAEVDRCAELLQPHLGLDLRTILYPEAGAEETAQAQLQQTCLTQPALFAIEYALAKLWISWGIKPQAAIGHSIGEYVAACLAGVFSLEDALALVATRGKLMQELPQGAMLSIPLPATEIQALFGEQTNEHLSLAAINTPAQCVVSGTAEAIAALQDRLQSRGIEYRPLHTSHAFHSAMMEPICTQFADCFAGVQLNSPQIPYLSNVTGTWITSAEATDPNYWVQHLRQTVRFADGVQALLQQSDRVFLEVGPGRTLSTFVHQHGNRLDGTVVLASMRHPRDKNSDVAFIQNALGQLWLAGVQIDWAGLYAHERRQRLPLPTYPFEHQRYWIDAPTAETVFNSNSNSNNSNGSSNEKNLSAQALLHKKSDVADWFYMPAWKRTLDPVRPPSLSEDVTVPYCTLICTDEGGLGAGIATQLEREGRDVITVKMGVEFAKLSDRVYNLDPSQQHHYDRLIESLHSQNWHPQQIIHLWSVTDSNCQESGQASELEKIDHAQETGFYSLLFLAQTLAKHKVTHDIQIAIVSNHLQQVTGLDRICPEKATILGPLKVIPQEYPNITCHSIDVSIPTSPQSLQKLVGQLVTELTADSTANINTTVAYRGSHRWEQTFEPVRLDKSAADLTRLREEGVYLITGGLGKIGLLLAEHLARTVRCRLILVGRSQFPARAEWEQRAITSDENDSIGSKVQKLLELEALGTKTLVVRADVSDLQQMQAAIAQAEEQFGSLHGVIHAAGVTGAEAFCTINRITDRECSQQFQPKVRGVAILQSVLRERELDFCLLMSSLSSVLGGLGFVAYAAANAYLDAFVQQLSTNSNAWASVNWDGWQFDPQQAPATAGQGNLAEFALMPDEGIQAFQRILSRLDLDRWVVSTGDLQARLDRWTQQQPLRNSKRSGSASSNRDRPSLRSIYVAPGNEIEQTIANTWESILGIEAIGIHDDFFELGGNSLMAIQIISRLREIYCVDLPVDVFFETPTIHNAARTILETQVSDTDSELLAQMLAEVAQLSEADAQQMLLAQESM